MRKLCSGVAALLSGFALLGGAPAPGAAAPGAVPLVAHYPMEPDPTDGKRLPDAGPLKLHGRVGAGAGLGDGGHKGKTLQLSGNGDSTARVSQPGLIARLGDRMTVTAWVRMDAYPQGRDAGLLAKRSGNVPTPFALSVGRDGKLGFEGYNGLGWENLFTGPNAAPRGAWFHLAFTYRAGGKAVFYVNGKPVASRNASRALAANDQDLVFGRDPYRGAFAGALDEVRLYAGALTPEQVALDMAGTLRTRVAAENDFPDPTHPVLLALARYDMPRGFTQGYGRTRHTARRAPGPDAVDWPVITWKGKPVFEKDGEERVDVPLRDGGEARPLFQQPGDEVLSPGNHWFRPLQWRWGQRYVYTTDRTARSWHNDYELWTFPVLIRGAGAADVKNVVLTVGGKTVYRNAGPLRSLTLLLPQNEAGKPYALSVGGRGPVRFDAGLRPVTPGHPHEALIPIRQTLPGAGPEIVVENRTRPETFPDQTAWDEDVKALRAAPAAVLGAPATVGDGRRGAGAGAPMAPRSLRRYLGREVPRSPLTINALALPHGMSGGAFFSSSDHLKKFEGSVGEFARYVADTGYDRIFERSSEFDLVRALSEQGVQYGLVPGVEWKRPFLAHPNVAFFSHLLPDFHQPLYRDLQLSVQRLGRYGNFGGVSIGADNGAYVSFWDWAPPIPNRPWGEAFEQFQGAARPREIPLPRHLGGKATVKEFVDYIARYDATFRQYGYFGRAVSEVDPSVAATTGSYGSSPGVGGRGGWPFASVPGRDIYAGMNVQQAYDWNEVSSSKPMHLPALIDRIRSYHPDKTTWAIVDDFKLFFGREARQRAYALALTRGVQAVGTTFLATPTGGEARPKTVSEQKELYAWIHKYGGAYALTEPVATVGILYVHPQALLRRVNQNGNAPDEELFQGSHEGKVTEALFLSHAAGWPARVVTPEEVKRGLPPHMKALLLVGLNRFDDTWVWHEGLAPDLRKFVAAGGRVLADDESVSPVPATKTGMRVRAYIAQSETDRTPDLLKRNADNRARLRTAMQGVTAPVAASSDPTVWAVPTTAGDVRYVTVVNQGYEDGKNASQFVRPQTGTLVWNTKRPIYDLRLGRKLTPAEARTVDLTRDAFRWYAVPPAEVEAPKVTVSRGEDGFYRATVSVRATPMRGVPVQVTVEGGGGDLATVYGATETAIRLPLYATDDGAFTITATELLSNLSGKREIQVTADPNAPRFPSATPVGTNDSEALAKFIDRKAVPLVVAFTTEQAKDPRLQAAAKRLIALFEKRGRSVRTGLIEPNGVVLSLQPLRAAHRYPQWRTLDADLVLFGNPSDNVLMLDQLRGGLIPGNWHDLSAPVELKNPVGMHHVSYSPFVGEYNVLNIVAAKSATVSDAALALEVILSRS